MKLTSAIIFLFLALISYAQPAALDKYNMVWNSQSNNSSESMPCGGGDVGLNVWVENGELLFYISKTGTFDENNCMLKMGRVRVKLSPNPFNGNNFRQELILKDGYVKITSADDINNAEIKVWVDVFRPVVHVDINTSNPTVAEATYESWRYADKPVTGRANNANSYKWAPRGEVKTYKDDIAFFGNGVLFNHRNKTSPSIFDITVEQQGMQSVKNEMYNPLLNLTFGGRMEGKNMKPAGNTEGVYVNTDYKGWKLQSIAAAKTHNVSIYLYSDQTASLADWIVGLNKVSQSAKETERTAEARTRKWWNDLWKRSFIFIDSAEDSQPWQAARNYQLFRYMLACNAYGNNPTKFNGGLFTYDPVYIDTSQKFTPDFRNWGGGTHTAQNQRLVYFPMLKSGDADLMKPQFDFYLRALKNAELRSKVYWEHEGACFTEQLENFGLPNAAEYGWGRPAMMDKGVEYNAWLEYEWDTVLEFCLMMLETQRYEGSDISRYIPFIESCLKFFDAHYQYLAKLRGRKTLDANGHLVLYPGSGAETFKMAYNSSSTIAALQTVTKRMLELPANYLGVEKRRSLDSFLKRIPPLQFTSFNGHTTIAPAKAWERINNVESPQLYPVFPWGIFGIGKPGLDTALNTWKYDTNVIKFRSYVGWKQDNIFAARLGLTADAATLTFAKLQNSGRRFPAFWGPGFDWTPDHNWGGSGMIGLQEMLVQADGQKIYLFPAWPKTLDVHFKLHAPYQTTVEAILQNGKLKLLKVIPESRAKDIVNMLY